MAIDASIVSGGFNFLSGAITQSYNNKVAQIGAKANAGIKAGNNVVVQAENARNATMTAMQRWAQKVRNQRVLENVAANQEATAVNFNRARDAKTRANFADNVRQAEESGRMAAAAAASGVTGSVVDVVNDTYKMRNAIANTTRLDNEGLAKSDFEKMQFEQLQAGMDQLDFTVIMDQYSNYDLTSSTAQTKSVASAGFGAIGADGLKGISNALAGLLNPKSGTASDGLTPFLKLNDNFNWK